MYALKIEVLSGDLYLKDFILSWLFATPSLRRIKQSFETLKHN